MKTDLKKIAGYVLSIIILGIALLHAYWVLEGTWFLETALNTPLEDISKETMWITWFFVAGMIIAIFIALGRAEIYLVSFIPLWIYRLGIWGFTIIMLMGAIFNFLIPRFWDRWVFAPIFWVIAILSFVLNIQKKIQRSYDAK